MPEFPTLGFLIAASNRHSSKLLGIGIICSLIGLGLLKRAWDNDTLLPGTLTIYIPKWIFILGGLLLQAPLPLTFWYLKAQEHL